MAPPRNLTLWAGDIRTSHPPFISTHLLVTDHTELNSIQQYLYKIITTTLLVIYPHILWWILTVVITMNQIQVNSITCFHCDETFLSKGKYQSHYKQKHQNEVRINEGMTVFRSENGKFICVSIKRSLNLENPWNVIMGIVSRFMKRNWKINKVKYIPVIYLINK